MSNNAYEQFINSGMTIEEFAVSKQEEWVLSSTDIIKYIKADMGKHRANQYPDLKDQLDALWHDIDNNTLDSNGVFYTLLKTIKDNNPKIE